MESAKKGISTEGAIGIAAGLISLLIDPNKPVYRVTIVIASTLLIANAVRKSGWTEEKHPEFSVISGFCENETKSHWRQCIGVGIVIAMAIVFAIETWPPKEKGISDTPVIPIAKTIEGKPRLIKPPIPKTPSPTKPVLPAQVFQSPDPYVGQSDEVVAHWAIQEADSVDDLAGKCRDDITTASHREDNHIPPDPAHGFHSKSTIQFLFFTRYKEYHEQALAKLHESLDFRLGPVETASEKQGFERLQMSVSNAGTAPQEWAWDVCGLIPGYVKELREMAVKLNH